MINLATMHQSGLLGMVTVILSWADLSTALLPTVCVENATTSGVCCPIPDDYVTPCGWPVRGECALFSEATNGDSRLDVTTLQGDYRIHWPNKFFQYGCQCYGNYHGYQCSECIYGFAGKNCLRRVNVVRKNALFYSTDEKKQFVQAVNMSKYTPSEYSALLQNENVDTQQPEAYDFHPVTIYDLFIFRHYFASRATKLTAEQCVNTLPGTTAVVDFAHGGPSLLPWHRLMLLSLERELQKLSGDPTFAIPYWDWTDVKGTYCPVCTADFFGETDYNDPQRRLKVGQPFSDWSRLCDNRKLNGCDVCDPRQPMGRLSRNPGGNPLFPDMPGSDQLRYVMSLSDYDINPYSPVDQNNRSFVQAVGGFIPWKSLQFMFHSQAHFWFNGTMSSAVSTSPNDPIFLLHHGFIDKVYEGWLRKYKPTPEQYPNDDSVPVGHSASDPIVPFFPIERNIDYFKDSREFSYDYDELESIIEHKELTLSADAQVQEAGAVADASSRGWVVYVVVAAAMVAAITMITATLALLWRKASRRVGESDSERAPLLPATDNL